MCARGIGETPPECELVPGPNSIAQRTVFSTLFFLAVIWVIYTSQSTTEIASWYFKHVW